MGCAHNLLLSADSACVSSTELSPVVTVVRTPHDPDNRRHWTGIVKANLLNDSLKQQRSADFVRSQLRECRYFECRISFPSRFDSPRATDYIRCDFAFNATTLSQLVPGGLPRNPAFDGKEVTTMWLIPQ